MDIDKMELKNLTVKFPIISEVDIGYAAGFYEGEGSCIHNKNATTCHVSITQKDPEPLVKLKKLFGGEIRVYNGYNYWRLFGIECKIFIIMIFDQLSDRRKKQILRFHDYLVSGDSCPNGHEYIEGSYKIVNDTRDRSYRTCLICLEEHGKRNRNPINKAAVALVSARGISKGEALEFLTNAKTNNENPS